jgi:hypothetical protein
MKFTCGVDVCLRACKCVRLIFRDRQRERRGTVMIFASCFNTAISIGNKFIELITLREHDFSICESHAARLLRPRALSALGILIKKSQ